MHEKDFISSVLKIFKQLKDILRDRAILGGYSAGKYPLSGAVMHLHVFLHTERPMRFVTTNLAHQGVKKIIFTVRPFVILHQDDASKCFRTLWTGERNRFGGRFTLSTLFQMCFGVASISSATTLAMFFNHIIRQWSWRWWWWSWWKVNGRPIRRWSIVC